MSTNFLKIIEAFKFPRLQLLPKKSAIVMEGGEMLWGIPLPLIVQGVPVAVGIYILNSQEKNLKETLATQDKNQKDALLALEKTLITQDKNQKDALETQSKNLKDALETQSKNLKDALETQSKNTKDALANEKALWNLKFDNLVSLFENSQDKK